MSFSCVTFFFRFLFFLFNLELWFFNSLRLSISFIVLLRFRLPNVTPWLFLSEIPFFLSTFEIYLQLGINPVLMVPSTLQANYCSPPPVLTSLTILFMNIYYVKSDTAVLKWFTILFYDTVPEGLVTILYFKS